MPAVRLPDCARRFAVGAALALAASRAAGADAQKIALDAYSPLSSSAEIARRVLTPLTLQRMQPHLSELAAQPVDPAHETFVLRVPDGAPPERGYGLLVFIPPWPEATVPRDWARVLDRYGILFVSAAHSGNDAGLLDRRVPLALLGYENVRRRYALDPDRVYVGGLSGGGRVALRVALAYPDVFRGALLNAGSDPIGEGLVFAPPADLVRRFQESTRLVYVTGARDEMNLHNDAVSRTSLQSWCAFGVYTETMPRRGHEIADAAGLAEALKDLEKPWSADADRLAACRGRLGHEISEKVAAAAAALDRGDRDAAMKAVEALDVRYGNFAADAIDRLAAKIESESR